MAMYECRRCALAGPQTRVNLPAVRRSLCMHLSARASHLVGHAPCVQDNMAGLLRSWQRLSGLTARAVDTAGAAPAYYRSLRTVAFASIEEAAPAAVRTTAEIATSQPPLNAWKWMIHSSNASVGVGSATLAPSYAQVSASAPRLSVLLHLQEAPAGKVKRPPTAYSRYVADNYASAQAANPELKGVGPIGKVLGKQWAELPEAQKVGFRVQSGNACDIGHSNSQQGDGRWDKASVQAAVAVAGVWCHVARRFQLHCLACRTSISRRQKLPRRTSTSCTPTARPSQCAKQSPSHPRRTGSSAPRRHTTCARRCNWPCTLLAACASHTQLPARWRLWLHSMRESLRRWLGVVAECGTHPHAGVCEGAAANHQGKAGGALLILSMHDCHVDLLHTSIHCRDGGYPFVVLVSPHDHQRRGVCH